MISKLLKVFLLLAMLAIVVVNADGDNSTASGDSTNEIDQCIRKNNCAVDDRACISACAGVPWGGNDVANKTHDCYEKCYNDYLSGNNSNVNVDGYTKCTQDCKANVYQQGVTEPGSSVPSSGASGGGSSGSSGSGGQDNNGGNSSENATGNVNSTQNSTGASFTTGATSYAYVFTAIFACVVFGVGL